MTQKELFYVEDAIEHEKTIIEVINSTIEDLEDNDLIEFMSNELTNHEDMKTNLLNLMKENLND